MTSRLSSYHFSGQSYAMGKHTFPTRLEDGTNERENWEYWVEGEWRDDQRDWKHCERLEHLQIYARKKKRTHPQ